MLVLNPCAGAAFSGLGRCNPVFMLRKYAIGPLLRSRSSRLLIPLIFGMLVIVPPQAYDQIVESLGYPAGFLISIRGTTSHSAPSSAGPVPAFCCRHGTTLVRGLSVDLHDGARRRSGRRPGLVSWIERKLAFVPVGRAAAGGASAAFAAYRLVLSPGFPSTHALFGDWYNHARFATVFLLGFLLARAEAFWDAIERQRWMALSARGCVLCILARIAMEQGGWCAAILCSQALWRHRLRLLSMACIVAVSALPALAHRGFQPRANI